MTFTLAGPTKSELHAWIRTHIPDLGSYLAADGLLKAFDFAEKGTPSRNNRTEISLALTATPPGESPFTLPTAEQATTNLTERFHITYKPPTTTIDLPAPVVVSRHQCPFCRRYTRKDPAAVTRHMASCFRNPGLRCCKTCVHHHDGSHPEDDESCTHEQGPEPEDYSFPVLNCPLWQPEAS